MLEDFYGMRNPGTILSKLSKHSKSFKIIVYNMISQNFPITISIFLSKSDRLLLAQKRDIFHI